MPPTARSVSPTAASPPFTITSGKLFDLKFYFQGDSTLLPFEAGTEIANSSLEIIPLDTFPGSISNGIVIINQPDSVQAYPDNDVIFAVTTTGNVTYQWQENTGSNWTDLQNNSTYSGVDDDTLSIFDVALSFNGYTYRCVMTSGNCSDTSGIALLEVALAYPAATLGSILSCPEFQVYEPVFVGDFLDVTEFTFNISFDTFNLDFQGIENIHPALSAGSLTVDPMANPAGISIHWEDAIPVSVTSGKLFDIDFIYHSSNNIIAFEDGTEAINSFANPINLTLTNGHINQHTLPVLTQQPEDLTVTEGDDAQFSVEATGATGYQWQVSMDEGLNWTDLTNTLPYYNVNTATLTINPTSLELNGYLFSCQVENDYCTVISGSALLTVDSLISTGQEMNIQDLIFISPNPFSGFITLTVVKSMTNIHVQIFRLTGELVFTGFNANQTGAGQMMNLSSLSNGIYVLKISGIKNNQHIHQTQKIIKTD